MSPTHKRADPPASEHAEDATGTPDPGAPAAAPPADAGGGATPGAPAPAPPTDTPPAAPAAGELAEARDRWLRAEAEMQNVRRRAAREIDETRRSAEEAGYRDLIELLDDLDRAIAAARAKQADAAWLQGVELVAQRMRDLLARADVTRVGAEGLPFDPHLHEALMETPAPEGVAPGTVVHEIRAGYRRGDRVLRPARVAVAAEPTPDDATDG